MITSSIIGGALHLPSGWEKMTVLEVRIQLFRGLAGHPVHGPQPDFEIRYLDRPTGHAIVALPDMMMVDVPYPYFYNQGLHTMCVNLQPLVT